MKKALANFANRAVAWATQKTGGPNNPFFYARNVDGSEKPELRRPMAQSPYVMRAIKRIADPIAAAPLRFYLGSEEVMDPAITAWWDTPFVGFPMEDAAEATVGSLKLYGEVFYLLDDSWLTTFGTKTVKPILALPRSMRAIRDGDELVGWEYRDGAGKSYPLLTEQVVQVKFWNPDDPIRGLGEFEAAKIAANADFLAARLGENLMQANGDRGVFVIAKQGMTDVQQKQFVQTLREKKLLAQNGILKPTFIVGDVTIEDPKTQALDSALIETRKMNQREIFNALGVPTSMIDPVAAYSVGAASDRFVLLEETCMPLAKKIARAWGGIERRRTGSQAVARFDFSDHSVMQQVREGRTETAAKLWGMGMPLKEVNDYLKLGMKEFKGWDIGYLPYSVTPAGDAPDFAKDPALGEPPAKEAEDPVKALEEVLRARRAQLPELGTLLCQRAETKAAAAKAAKREQLWKKHMSQRAPAINALQAKINGALMEARATVLRKLAEHGAGGKAAVPAETRSLASYFMFDKDTFGQDLKARLGKGLRSVYEEAGKQFMEEISYDDPFNAPPARVTQFVTERQNRLKGVADEVFESIKATIQDGLDRGASTDDLQDDIRDKFNEISRGRARTIASTEVSAAYGTARQDAMTQAGITKKKWLTSGNANVRPAHRAAEGQTVPVDEPFVVDGEELMCPGDADGSPENVINCHCVSIAEDGDEEGAEDDE